LLKVAIDKCNSDHLCVSVCPVGAAGEDSEGKIVIDAGLCMECYACMNICPQEVIFEEND